MIFLVVRVMLIPAKNNAMRTNINVMRNCNFIVYFLVYSLWSTISLPI